MKKRNISSKKPLKSKTINKKRGDLIDWNEILESLFGNNIYTPEIAKMSDQELKTLYNMTMSNRDTYDTDSYGNKGFFIPLDIDIFARKFSGRNNLGEIYQNGREGTLLYLDENGNPKLNDAWHGNEWVDENNNPLNIKQDPNDYYWRNGTKLRTTPIRQYPNRIPDYVRMKGDKGNVSYTDNQFNKHMSGKPQPLKYATPFKNKYSK